MMGSVKTEVISGKKCIFCPKGSKGPVILLGMDPGQGNSPKHLLDCLNEITGEKEFLLAAFSVEDWDRDFSPWKTPAILGDRAFGGGGPETLNWLTEKMLPRIEEIYGGERELFLAGYSLAGLFSLWCASECDLFSGIACCSGSLWYPGWPEYASSHPVRSSCSIYLSLGGKEEHSPVAMMAAVGDRTREEEKRLKKEKNVKHVILQWNRGGHFADSGKRLADGIAWLLEKRSDAC